MITVGSCFSGVGGIELGLEWTGKFKTRWQIENDEFATKVLEKHWPNVKRYRDIRDVIRPEPVDLICGGFPCQDVSLAGSRTGLKGKRSNLWGEMFRLVCEVRPRWVVAENVPGLLSSDDGRFFGNILRDLAGAGYNGEWGMLSAAGVGAPHLRKRIFILAYSPIERHGRFFGMGVCKTVSRNRKPIKNEWETQGRVSIKMDRTETRTGRGTAKAIWPPEPPMDRVVARFPGQMDRIKCLGNSVVPAVAQKIGEMILRAGMFKAE